jgi:hypothetical protein
MSSKPISRQEKGFSGMIGVVIPLGFYRIFREADFPKHQKPMRRVQSDLQTRRISTTCTPLVGA